jgi:predicted DCC family thiol-disulfide oxidoreductase YuxK
MIADRATLIYDGSCGFCRDTVEWVRRRDRAGRLDYVPFQEAVRVAPFAIPVPILASAMHLVRADRTVFSGADAAPEILRLLPRWRWLAWTFAVPGVLPLARRAYAWIAARRRCLAFRPGSR